MRARYPDSDGFVEHDGLIKAFAEFDEGLDARAGFLGTGFEQCEKLVFFA